MDPARAIFLSFILIDSIYEFRVKCFKSAIHNCKTANKIVIKFPRNDKRMEGSIYLS